MDKKKKLRSKKIAGIRGWIQAAATPVSYTHLDVYKRQGMHGESFPQPDFDQQMRTLLQHFLQIAGIGFSYVAFEKVKFDEMCIRDSSRIVTTSRALCRKAVQNRGEPVRPCLQQRIFLAHRSS